VLIPRSCTAFPFWLQSCVPITCNAPEFEGVASAPEFTEAVCAADVACEVAAVSAVTALEAEAVSTSAVVDVVSVCVTAAVVAAVAAVVAAAVVAFGSVVAMVSETTDEVASVPFPHPARHTSTADKIIAVKNLKLNLYIPI
jgi:hypothetical protein